MSYITTVLQNVTACSNKCSEFLMYKEDGKEHCTVQCANSKLNIHL